MVLVLFCIFPTGVDFAKGEPLTVKVGAYDNAPKIFFAPDGSVDGFFADIVEYIAEQEGWDLQWVTGTWTECLAKLESNEIDVMVDVAYSAERAQIYNFTNEAVFVNWGTVYTRSDSSIQSILDLQDQVVVVMANSIHTTGEGGILNLLDQFDVNCTIVEVEDYEAVFEYLDQDKADAGIVNRLFGMTHEASFNVRKTTIVFNPVDLKFAFTKNGPQTAQLTIAFDKHLKELKANENSIYYQALNDHLLGTSGGPIFQLPSWVVPVLIVGVCFIVFLVLVSAMLRKRKAELQVTNQLLNSTNAELETLVAMIPDGILVIDMSGVVRLVNDTFNAIYKHAVGPSLEPGLNIRDIPEKATLQTSILSFLNTLEPHPTTVEIEKGSWVQLIATFPRINPKREPFGVIIEARDISYFVEYDNLRKQFVSTVSHELRTPITAIDLALRNLERFKDKMTEEQKSLMVESMARSAKVLKTMIEDLLVLSRVDSQRISLNRAQFPLYALVDSIELELSSKMNARDIILEKDVSPDLILDADETRLAQVIRILLDNAIKFSQDAGTVSIRATTTRGNASDGKQEMGVLIEVMDRGIGIRERDKTHLFERFFRSEDARDIQGTGLGLSIAKELVNQHGGSISVESKFGEGSTFSVFLPQSSEDSNNPNAQT